MLLTAEAASLEEEDDVQILWANLIANAVDPEKKAHIKKVYIELLKSLSPAEATFLNLLWNLERHATFKNQIEINAFNKVANEIAERTWRIFDAKDRRAVVQNLVRLRCVTFRPRNINLGNLFAALPPTPGSVFANRWASINPQQFENLIRDIMELLWASAGVKQYGVEGRIPVTTNGGIGSMMGSINLPEMNYMLTPLGNDLMGACSSE